MKHARFYPDPQAQQAIWLQTFSGKLPGHATVLGLVAGVVTAAAADCLWLIFIMETWLPAVRTWAKSCTDVLVAAQNGTDPGVISLPVFVAPALPTGVTAQLPGSLDRIFALVQEIKDNPACTDAIATDLGIVGGEDTTLHLTTAQPPLTVVFNGVHVDIKSGWGGHRGSISSIEVQKDWGDTRGFVHLATLTSVSFRDNAPLPATRTVWAYRVIYQVGNEPTGQWSNTVSVAVGG